MAAPVSTVATIASAATLPVTAASPSATAAERPPPAAFGLRARFVDIQGTAAKLSTIKSCNRAFGFRFIRHFHERKSPRPARIAICLDADPLYLAVSFK
jgi:hypothetical protein